AGLRKTPGRDRVPALPSIARANAAASEVREAPGFLPGALGLLLQKRAKMDKRTVLVVDDHADIRSLLKDYLEAGNFEVLSAVDGPQALQTLSTVKVEMVILDLQMPGCDGFEVCRRIRKDSAVPILVLSART